MILNNFNLSESKQNALLKMAGKKLGKSPDELKNQLESGNLDNVIRSLDPGTASKVNSVLQDPQAVEQLMKNDQVRNLLGNLMNNNQGK